ncbi:MAG: PIN domain-containing protein [Candidatus Aenigmatarchaeota archaeon]
MFLVLDTNVLFSFFKRAKVFRLVSKLSRKGAKLLVPNLMADELKILRPKILRYSKLSEKELNEVFETLFSLIKPIEEDKYLRFLEEAKKISPHKKDIPLFALSLAFNKAPIWSREAKLKRQKLIKVLTDKEVEDLLKSK